MSAVHETSAEGSPKAEPVQGIGDQNDTEAARSDVVASSPPYSTFTKLEKGWIVFLVALAGVFSPLSSFIYYPAINSIANDLHVSIEKINLTITSYMVVSGIAPSIIGDIADMFGRRPAYILLLTVYLVANISLALQNSYPALLVLRMLQSFGSSGTISAAYGVVADIASPAERGSYVGAVICGPNVAPSLGPLLGGVLADRAGWRWIFWVLTILSGISLLTIFIYLPETARSIVGNGSIPANGINRSCLSWLSRSRSEPEANPVRPTKRPLHIPNPMTCLYVLFNKDTSLIILVNAVFYTTYCCIQASLSSLFIKLYGFTELQAGLIYFPFGFGCLLSSYLSGKVLDIDYRAVADAHGIPVNKAKGEESNNFPIEKARLRSIWYSIFVCIGSVSGYGWSLEAKAHVAVPLVLQFFIGATTTPVFNTCGTLLIDIYPQSPATAQASLNIVRCFMSAGGLALLQLILDRLGVGFCFLIFAATCATAIPMLLVERRWGMKWRLARGKRLESEEALKREERLSHDEGREG